MPLTPLNGHEECRLEMKQKSFLEKIRKFFFQGLPEPHEAVSKGLSADTDLLGDCRVGQALLPEGANL